MKYGDMTDEQKKEYNRKIKEREKLNRRAAKGNIHLIKLTLEVTPELASAILAAIELSGRKSEEGEGEE